MRKHKKYILYRCSFCAKTQKQVLRLVAGPSGVFICDTCVAAFQQDGLDKHKKHKDTLCSFCRKSQGQVVSLVVGNNVYICEECLDLCQEIIAEEQRLH